VHADVLSEIDVRDGGRRDGTRRVLPDQRQHRSVVVLVSVDIEQVTAGSSGRDDRIERRAGDTGADVDHALEHRGQRSTAGRQYAANVNLGAPELLIILVVILLIFGSTKLPKLARSLGQAQNEFKKGIAEGGTVTEHDEDGKDTTATT
jgi:sec-independent protein translocase protein TatA